MLNFTKSLEDVDNLLQVLKDEPEIAFQTSEYSRTLLHVAAGHGILDIVAELLNMGVNPNQVDEFGETPLLRSIRFRRDDVTDMLIPVTSLDKQDRHGDTALHRACQMGSAHSVIELLKNGANPHIKNAAGKTALEEGSTSYYARSARLVWEPILRRHMDNVEFCDILQLPTQQLQTQPDAVLNEDDPTQTPSPHKRATPSPHKRSNKSSPVKRILSFRQKYPANLRTSDGHFVRSKAELIIDNWLYENNISHAVEPSLTLNGKTLVPDFYLNGLDCYIEFWGLETEDYQHKRNEKLAVYKEYDLAVISLNEQDIQYLDDVMTSKLSEFNWSKPKRRRH